MAQGSKASIVGIGSYVPEKVLTNRDLEKMVNTSDEWIVTRTGIKERRLAAGDEAASNLGIKAAGRALDQAGVKPEDLDMVIAATITGDMVFPSTSCLIQAGIGAASAGAFDLSAACSGFIYAMTVADSMIRAKTARKVLVVGTEILSRITDWEDRNTCVLFGDGAGAAVLTSGSPGAELLASDLGADGTCVDMLNLPAGGSRMPPSHKTVDEKLHCIKMSGNEVFKIAVKSMGDTSLKCLSQCGLTAEDIDYFIPHQANYRIIDAVARRLNVPPEKLIVNIHKYGNISSASTIVALDEAVREGKIKKGDIVLMAAFGGGLTWASCVLRW